MKRIISLCCVCLTLLMSLAVPAKATDFDNTSNWIELLDYGTVNNSGENSISFTGSFDATFTQPSSSTFGYLEILFYSNQVPSSIDAVIGYSSTSMTISRIGTNYYRAYCMCPDNLRSRTVTFRINSTSTSTTRITFFSVKMHLVRINPAAINAKCEIVSSNFQDIINYVPTDDINYRIFPSGETLDELWFICYITVPNWKMYDYIDFQFFFECFAITSVTAIMGSTNLPLSVSTFNDTSLGKNTYYVSMRLDCSGLERTSTDYPMITIMGQLEPSSMNSVDFANCSGFVLVDNYDPYLFFFSQIWTSLSSGFPMLQTEIRDLGTSISMEFTNLKSTINTFSSNVNSWIRTQTTAIESQFTSLKSSLNTWILNQTKTLESAIRGDPASGDDFQDQVDQKDQALEDMAAVMDSVTKPDVQDINVSVDQYIDPADVQVLATPLTVFLEADLFRTMIIMSILLATVSFTLYGKR